MIKIGLLCGVICVLSASGLTSTLKEAKYSNNDSKLIVELEKDIDSISEEDAIRSQNNVFKQIKQSVNRNAKFIQNFSLLNNAFAIDASKDNIEAIKSISGVKSVTLTGTHVINTESLSGGQTFKIKKDAGATFDPNINYSAQTMEKPDNTNDGEGTLIAILDNEFYLKGAVGNNPAYCHETFSPLTGTKVRLEYGDVLQGSTHANTFSKMHGNNAGAGEEGSLYFNNKVPFYFDYAGDSTDGSSSGAVEDFDVESKIGLHGSHVASIAGGNAENYKGIAPKAQLCLMKVFSDIKATPIGEAAKTGNYSTFSEIGFLNALEDSIKLGVDAINVSIGSDLADFEMDSIVMKTLRKLTNSNVLTSISAGNGGKSAYSFTGGYGNWTREMIETGIMGSYANNPTSMTIAAGQPDSVYYANALVSNGGEVIAYQDQIVNRDGVADDYRKEHKLIDLVTTNNVVNPEKEIEYVYVGGFGKSTDYKGKDVSGKIAIVNRGSINFSDKYTNAYDAGACALVIVNNDPTANDFNFRCDFGGEQPDFPCALVLYKDLEYLTKNPIGSFKIGKDIQTDNKIKRTISDFSTDGATYDLDLKPEITTPGSNIKGAVWPQNDEEKETPLAAYEYFNGTSMAAPNYEGALAVVLSKMTKDMLSDNYLSSTEKTKLNEFKKTIDMRFMSTAKPMLDAEANDEDSKKTLTSPRMQGAGMANIKGAYNTDVYLKGSDSDGSVINRSKILLRNNADIAKGDIKLSFTAVNESNTARTYNGTLKVLRPAYALNNTVLTSDYNYLGELDDVKNIPGFIHYSPEKEEIVASDGTASYKDAFKVSRIINYYIDAEDYNTGTKSGVIQPGMYYNAEKDPTKPVDWQLVPNTKYQSVKDVEIASIPLGTITANANSSTKITLDTYSLTDAQRKDIADLYPYGTYIEGFVMLKATQSGAEDLSIPYMGFYSRSEVDANNSYSSAPVVEPFSFEKDKNTIYPSDLINDVTKQLLGKEKVDFSSMWLTGYAESTEDVSIDDIITNDDNFGNTKGFKSVATIPDVYSSVINDNPKDNIYVGSPTESNTMIIQQFVLRSVKDNNFTITNKSTGKVVYKSALEDMLFGDVNGKYCLYKSHLDADYLSAGYVAHRAYAIVPLYDLTTHKAFEGGNYEIKFNYQLAGTDKWVSKSYNMIIDAESPEIISVHDVKVGETDKVRITMKDNRAAYVIVNSNKVDVNYDSATNTYYADVDKSLVDSCVRSNDTTSYSEKRLFVEAIDYAFGKTSAIIHFTGNDYSHFEIVQGHGLAINNDFDYKNGTLKFIEIDEYYFETEVTINSLFKVTTGDVTVEASGSGCSGSVVAPSLIASASALIGLGLLILVKSKKEENFYEDK